MTIITVTSNLKICNTCSCPCLTSRNPLISNPVPWCLKSKELSPESSKIYCKQKFGETDHETPGTQIERLHSVCLKPNPFTEKGLITLMDITGQYLHIHHKNYGRALLINYSSTLNTISRKLLVCKLHEYGYHPSIVNWL